MLRNVVIQITQKSWKLKLHGVTLMEWLQKDHIQNIGSSFLKWKQSIQQLAGTGITTRVLKVQLKNKCKKCWILEWKWLRHLFKNHNICPLVISLFIWLTLPLLSYLPQLCMLCSVGYHLFCCHRSEKTSRRWMALDYAGVSIGILGCYVPGVFYTFYCNNVS